MFVPGTTADLKMFVHSALAIADRLQDTTMCDKFVAEHHAQWKNQKSFQTFVGSMFNISRCNFDGFEDVAIDWGYGYGLVPMDWKKVMFFF
jgi:hypothetical protein